jgi:hypothetical protein
MRDNFVYAASADGEVDDSGGAETHTHGNQTVGEAGEHTHSISVSVGDSGYNERASDYGGTSAMADQHSHSGSGNFDTDPDHDHTLGDTESGSSLPQYMYLYYVMRAE